MQSVTELAPLANFVLILITAWITIVRVKDMLQRIERTSERIVETMANLDKRLTIVETLCAFNHPNQPYRIKQASGDDKDK